MNYKVSVLFQRIRARCPLACGLLHDCTTLLPTEFREFFSQFPANFLSISCTLLSKISTCAVRYQINVKHVKKNYHENT